jgi:hypothetical protein
MMGTPMIAMIATPIIVAIAIAKALMIPTTSMPAITIETPVMRIGTPIIPATGMPGIANVSQAAPLRLPF